MSRCPYCGLKYCERIDHKNERIAELEAQLDAVLGIKYHTHPSWNCGKDFDDGWNACRKQIDDCIEQALGGDDDTD